MRRNGKENLINMLPECDVIQTKYFIDEEFEFNYQIGSMDEFVKFYDGYGRNPKLEDSRGSIMHVASSSGRADILTVILESDGVEVNYLCSGSTPLYNAFLAGRLEAVKLLLSSGGVLSSNYHEQRVALHTFCSKIHQDSNKLAIIEEFLKQGNIEAELWGDMLIYALANKSMVLANLVSSDLVAKEHFHTFSYNEILGNQNAEYRDIYFQAIGNIFDNAEYNEIYTHYVLNDPFSVMSYLEAYQCELSMDGQTIEGFWRNSAQNSHNGTVENITKLVLAAMEYPEFAEQMDFPRLGKYNPKLASQIMDRLEECVGEQDMRLLTLLLQRKNFIALRNSYHEFHDVGMQNPVDFTLELCEGVSISLPLQVAPMEGAIYIGNSKIYSGDIQYISAYQKGLDALLKPCRLIIGDNGTQANIREGNADQEVSENRLVLYKRKRDEMSKSPIDDVMDVDDSHSKTRENGVLRDIAVPRSESHRDAIVGVPDALQMKRTFSMV